MEKKWNPTITYYKVTKGDIVMHKILSRVNNVERRVSNAV